MAHLCSSSWAITIIRLVVCNDRSRGLDKLEDGPSARTAVANSSGTPTAQRARDQNIRQAELWGAALENGTCNEKDPASGVQLAWQA